MKLAKYVAIFHITIKNQLAYFFNYIVGNVFLVVIMCIFYMLWNFMTTQGGGTIGGYTLNQLVWYLAITEIVVLSRSRSHMTITDDIKTGSIAYNLNKPYDYPVYQICQSFGEIGVKIIPNILVGVTVATLLVGPLKGFNILLLPIIALIVMLGAVLNMLIYLAIAISAFWLEENNALFWIYSKLVFTLGGMLVPIELFPAWLQRVALNMPFAYVTYGPAKLAVDFNTTMATHIVTMQLLYITLSSVLIAWLYRKGVAIVNVNGG